MEIYGFIFGIRFKNFSIQDKLGSIIDFIFDYPDSAFNREFFNKIRTSFDERTLMNEDTKNKLILNTENIIFEYNVKEDFKKELAQYLEYFDKIILQEIFKEFNLRQINRIGFVIRTKLKEHDTFLNNTINQINKDMCNLGGYSFNYKLTRKVPLEIKKNYFTEDYESDIISYEHLADSEDINMFIDYQKYFKPSLKVIDDLHPSYQKFCNLSLTKFEKRYLQDGKKK